MKMHARLVPACQCKHTACQCNAAGEHQHHGAESIQSQTDAKRCSPVAGQIDAHGIGLLVAPKQQRHGDQQPQGGREDIERGFCALVLFTEQQHQRRRQHGQHNRRQQQVGHAQMGKGKQQVGHGISCASRARIPSTWSVPDIPREASSTTKNNAVMAKPMTMAVSTSAWGRGSA